MLIVSSGKFVSCFLALRTCGYTFNIEPRPVLVSLLWQSHVFHSLSVYARVFCINRTECTTESFIQGNFIQQGRIPKRQSGGLFSHWPFKKIQSLSHDVLHTLFSIKDSDNHQISGNSVILNLTSYYVCVATTGFKLSLIQFWEPWNRSWAWLITGIIPINHHWYYQ